MAVDAMMCPEWNGTIVTQGRWFRVGYKLVPEVGEISRWRSYDGNDVIFDRARGMHDAGWAETAQVRVPSGKSHMVVLLIYFRRTRRR